MKRLLVLLLLLLNIFNVHAQTDSLMREMNKDAQGEDAVIATFKSDRLILSQTTTMVKKYNLDFKVAHRFGDVGGTDGGSRILWGLDNSSDIYIDFDYGISDRLNIGFGRSKYEQLLDLQLKYALFQQTANDHVPFSVSLLAKTGFTPYKVITDVFDDYGNRFSYLTQAIVSRKFSSNFSMQLSPTILMRNVVLNPGDEETMFALGAAARLKLSKRFGIVADYYKVFSEYRRETTSDNFYDPLGLGFEIETGGHVFTLTFVNAKAIVENNFLPNSTSSWGKGEYRFGFTISRMFSFKKSIEE